MPKGMGFKKTGNGPRYGGHSFSSKAGFSGSTGRKQEVRGYSRNVPKRKFADGGMVVAKMADPGSSVTRRTQPVTQFDAQHGGKGPLRPGFNKGGKACYAEGGKVGTVGAAIKMVKALMARGESADSAATKAASRYGVSKAAVASNSAATGGGGMPAEKQVLARGGLAGMAKRVMAQTAGSQGAPAPAGGGRGLAGMVRQVVGQAAPQRLQAAPPPTKLIGPRNAGPIKQAMSQAVGRAAPARSVGSFGRRPLFGG